MGIVVLFEDRGKTVMATLTFDTLAYAKRLRAVGVPEKQAEVQAEVFAEIIEERLATKQDMELLRRDMKQMELELKKDITASRSEVVKWVAGMLIAQAAVVATLVKLL
jgi:hypothetical protein